jgi:hypothetical protein
MSKAGKKFGQGPIGDFIEQRREIVLVLLVYLAVVIVIGGFRMNAYVVHSSYAATRSLAKNHRVQATDLGRPAWWPGSWGWLLPNSNLLIDKYVSVGLIKAGQAIDESKVQLQPDLTDLADPIDKKTVERRAVIFPIPAAQSLLCQYLDVNTRVDVMPAQPVTTGSKDFQGIPRIRVVAVGLQTAAADTKTPPPCFAVLAIPKDMEAYLEPSKLAGLHLVLNPPTPEPSPTPDASTKQIEAPKAKSEKKEN